MTAADYRMQIFELVSLYNGIFEIWLGLTFAFILAIHFSARTMNRVLFWLLGSLYLGAAAVFLFRYINLILTAALIRAEMLEAGFPDLPDALPGSGALILLGAVALMVGGTLGSLYFAYINRPRKDPA